MNKIIELDNVIFEDHTGVDYFEKLVKYFKEHELEILNFFRLDKYDKKWKFFLLNYPEFYDYIKRKHESSNIDISFISGDSSSDRKEIRLLSLEDANTKRVALCLTANSSIFCKPIIFVVIVPIGSVAYSTGCVFEARWRT